MTAADSSCGEPTTSTSLTSSKMDSQSSPILKHFSNNVITSKRCQEKNEKESNSELPGNSKNPTHIHQQLQINHVSTQISSENLTIQEKSKVFGDKNVVKQCYDKISSQKQGDGNIVSEFDIPEVTVVKPCKIVINQVKIDLIQHSKNLRVVLKRVHPSDYEQTETTLAQKM